jgi:hypothetical protein
MQPKLNRSRPETASAGIDGEHKGSVTQPAFWETPVPLPRFALAFLALLGLSAIPVFGTVLPPLLDYPNHLARMHILASSGASRVLAQFYTVNWVPLPDLAMDAIVPPLARLMPLEVAGKLFIVLIFALLAGGCAALNRVLHGRWSWWSLSGFLLVFNNTLQWGFVNYLFGLGIALGGLACWIATASWQPWRRVALAIAIALAAYLSHIAAFGVYALLVAGIEAAPFIALLRRRAWLFAARRVVTVGAQFVLPTALFAAAWLPSAHGETIRYDAPWRKITYLLGLFDNGDHLAELLCLEILVATLFILGLTGRLRLAPAMRWPLLLLLVVYLAMPAQALSDNEVDRRLPLPLALSFMAGILPWPASPGIARVAGATLLLLFGGRLIDTAFRWHDSDRIYRADLVAIESLPVGAKLAVAFPHRAQDIGAAPETELPVLAIMQRDAFVPTLFAFPAQQPVAFTPDYAALAAETDPIALWRELVTQRGSAAVSLPTPLEHYQYLAVVDTAPFQLPENPCLKPIRPVASLQLFAIDTACAKSD